jgi:hypothetical protein
VGKSDGHSVPASVGGKAMTTMFSSPVLTAVIVASPALFQVQCRTPRQIELANAFCRYLEMAQRA